MESDFSPLMALLPFIKNKTFIDIGAGKGAFAKELMANGFNGILFEPLPKYHSQLRNFQNQVDYQFYPFAIDDKDRIADFYFFMGFNNQPLDSLYLQSNERELQHKKIMSVICRSLDSLMKEDIINEEVGVLKIEVGGSDL